MSAPATLRALVYRAICKAWEQVLKLRTALASSAHADPTQILLDNFTDEQRAAADAQLKRHNTLSSKPLRLLVLIPFRDRWSLTAKCLASVMTQNCAGADVRIVLIDNGSTESVTASGIATSLKSSRENLTVTTMRIDDAFNFSRLNNKAVVGNADFDADFLLFLNNDVEFTAPTHIDTLLRFAASTPDLGAAGCTLLYPNGSIQHLFVAPGVKIVAAHPLKGHTLSPTAAWFARPRPVAAVTGAVMLVPADAFEAVGGFDESLASVGQDVDLCLKLRRLGRTCWAVSQVRAVHYEGASRPGTIDKAQVRLLYTKWGRSLTHDSCYSERFSRWSETPLLRFGEGDYPWDKVLP